MSANLPGPNAGPTPPVQPDVLEQPQPRSPASSVCYANMDDAQEPLTHTTSPPNTVETAEPPGRRHHVGAASPGTATGGDEYDRTPRSEAPPPISTATGRHPLAFSQLEPDYFSPQPLRPYGSKMPASAPVSARPSPTASATASTTPANAPAPSLEDIVNPAARRPSVQRGDSNASTASVATMRPHSVDPYQTFTPLSKQGDGPHYPNQSYAALQFQQYPTSHHNQYAGRARSTHHHHHFSLSNAHIITSGLHSDHHRDIMDSGSRTMGNSPASSPGLFCPSTPPFRPGHHPDDGSYSSPYLHHTHRQAPKETHVADVDVDPVSGRKIINQYEVMDELGRGVHGKVKLGRNMDTGITVAIKIVDRYSKRRRLDKNTSREDKIKREIAILKKARHQNIVSLLEVIDDPTRKKVYIVLEHVELGEVRWRIAGEKEICLIEWRRYQRESQGIFQNDNAAVEDERIIALAHQKLARQQRRRARLMRNRRLGQTENEPWSLEHGGDSGDDYSASGRTSRASTISDGHNPNRYRFTELWERNVRQESNMETAVRAITPISTSIPSTGLEGTMYGAYDTDVTRGRTPSVAESSSSHFTDDEDEVPEHFRYVPLLTLQAALETFRDTVLGLQYLHFQKVIHRDIKPANLLQTKEHRIKISDFGVSYLGRARSQSEDGDQSESEDLGEAIELAKTVGTPAFYAPELCRIDDDGDVYPVSDAIDIWALGVTLYCLIYGRVPFHDQNTFHLMKKIAEDEVYIPQYRLKAVAEQSGSRPNSHGGLYHSMTTHKRAPHDLEYEEVDDVLRDLLKRLLTKDPRKRITIKEIKRHPWVLQGLENFDSWVEDTDPDRSSQGRRIEVSRDDMEKAVVPITLIDRVRSGMRKTLDTVFGVGRRGGSRRRAQSTATGHDQSPSISAHSSSSTVSQEGRRPSLAMNQSIFEALSRSREPEHPLSQSVTASPEAKERAKFFEPNFRTGSPAHRVESSEHLAPLAPTSRPISLERAHSITSSAASVRTIRPPDIPLSGRATSPGTPSALPGTPTALESPGSSNLGGIFGGVPRLVNNMRSRERLSRPLKPALDHIRAKPERLGDTYDDPHSGPSIALSTASAAGLVDQPDVLKDYSPSPVRGPWPNLSDVNAPDPYERASSRQSSVSSASSYLNRAYAAQTPSSSCPAQSPDYVVTHQPHQREAPDERHSRFRDESDRRKAADASHSRDRPLSMNFPRPTSALNQFERPPSPNAEASFQRQKVEDYLNQDHHTSDDASLVGYHTQTKGLASSSSEDHFTSMSQSTSNPSIPSVVSADSSVALEDHLQMHPPPSIGTAPSGDSIDIFGAHTDDPSGYDGDGDHPLESDDDDSDEEFIVMGRRKPAQSSVRSRPSSTAEPSKSSSRRSFLSERRRSARSGSNGTVKKIGPPGSTDSEQHRAGS